MAYIVTVDKKTFKVEIEKEDGVFKISLDGNPMEASIATAGNPSHISLIVGKKSYDVTIEDENTISVNGELFKTKVEDERFINLGIKKKSEDGGKTTVIAPMPGLVIEILVKEGDKIKADDGLVIIEAMKMQNELKAPRDGVIKQVFVQKGMPVNGGNPLVVIE